MQRQVGDGARPTLEHIRGLDGLRALAVGAVVAYHLDAPWAKGGFLGVDLFMVLSGFLITRIMIGGGDRWTIRRLPQFWTRRAGRLLPAVITLILIVSCVSASVLPATELLTVRRDGIAAIVYMANWRFVLSGTSYFDLFASPSPFRHLWSLAIEEQFYVLWPVVVALRVSRRALVAVTAVGIVASALAMAFLFAAADPSRAYFGTDTRAQTLLVGCLLAFALDRGIAVRSVLGRLVPIALLATVVAMVIAPGDRPFMYRGGFTAFASVAGVVVGGVVCSPNSRLVRVLERPAITAVGRMSYSIYLWHWPVIVLATERRLHVGGSLLVIVQLVVIGILSYSSYRFVEGPIRRRRFAPRTALGGVALATVTSLTLVVVVTGRAEAPPDYFSGSGEVVGAVPTSAPAADAEVTVARSRGQSISPVLVLGDSVPGSLTPGLLEASATRDVTLTSAFVSGCGLLPGFTVGVDGVVYEPSYGCESLVNDAVVAALEEVHPRTVIWQSEWDAQHREVDGQRIDPGTAAGQAVLLRLVGERVEQLEASGAHVVLVTNAPRGESATNGAAPGADELVHFLGYNDVLRKYAAEHPGVGLIELAAHICPAGAPCVGRTADGELYRPGDGIHYEGEPAKDAARWMIDELLKLDLDG